MARRMELASKSGEELGPKANTENPPQGGGLGLRSVGKNMRDNALRDLCGLGVVLQASCQGRFVLSGGAWREQIRSVEMIFIVHPLDDQFSQVESAPSSVCSVKLVLPKSHCHQPRVETILLPALGLVVDLQLQNLGNVSGVQGEFRTASGGPVLQSVVVPGVL